MLPRLLAINLQIVVVLLSRKAQSKTFPIVINRSLGNGTKSNFLRHTQQVLADWLNFGSLHIPSKQTGVLQMNKQLAALGLVTMMFGALQLPAQAELNVSLFGRHDRNHDGRWNYREFRDANNYYYQTHPAVEIINTRDMQNDFYRLDRNNDGYVDIDEVRGYRAW